MSAFTLLLPFTIQNLVFISMMDFWLNHWLHSCEHLWQSEWWRDDSWGGKKIKQHTVFVDVQDGSYWWLCLSYQQNVFGLDTLLPLIHTDHFAWLKNMTLPQSHTPFLEIIVNGFEKKGQFGPDLNTEILIFTESRKNKLSFNAHFMVIAAWVCILCAFM